MRLSEAHDTGFGGRVDPAAFEVRVADGLAGPNDGADLGVTGETTDSKPEQAPLF